MTKIIKNKIVYRNRWISINSKVISLNNKQYKNFYSLNQPDYVNIIVQTPNNKYPLVKQYRHAIGKFTYEFPSGLLDNNESYIKCAKREVLEETGHKIFKIYKLGSLFPDVGRMTNKLHMYFAKTKDELDSFSSEDGITIILKTKEQIIELIKKGRFLHQPHIGLFYLAILNNYIR